MLDRKASEIITDLMKYDKIIIGRKHILSNNRNNKNTFCPKNFNIHSKYFSYNTNYIFFSAD